MFLLILMSLLFVAPFVGTAGGKEEVDTPILFGISSVRVKEDSIEVVKDDTLPSGLDLWADGKRVERATVVIGDTFEVREQHLGYSFKLVEIAQGLATLEQANWTAFPGRERTRSTTTRVVRSYVTRRKEKR